MPRLLWQVRQAVSATARDLLTGRVSAVSSQTISVPEAGHLSSNELGQAEIFVYDGPGAGQSRRVATHVQDLATGAALLTPGYPWTNLPGTDSFVEIHLAQNDFTVQKINEAIRGAYKAAEDVYLTDVTDETVTTQVGRHHYPIPAGFRSLHSVEEDFPADVGVPGSVYDSGALNWGSQFYDQDRTLAATASQLRLSQGFYVSSGGQPQGYWAGGAALYLRRIGAPPATLTLRLEADAAGLPSGVLLDPNFGVATAAPETVSSTYSLVQFRWAAPVFIPSDWPLHLVLSGPVSPSPTDYVVWGEDTATAYNRGQAGRHNGVSWSVIPGSSLIFAIQTSQINERYRSIPRDDADGPRRRVATDSTGASLLWLRDPSEGARLRLRGQGALVPPVADPDAVLLPESFLVPKATSLLLAMQGAGPTTDSDNRDRWALYHGNLAERELPRLRTQFAPNSEIVTPR